MLHWETIIICNSSAVIESKLASLRRWHLQQVKSHPGPVKLIHLFIKRRHLRVHLSSQNCSGQVAPLSSLEQCFVCVFPWPTACSCVVQERRRWIEIWWAFHRKGAFLSARCNTNHCTSSGVYYYFHSFPMVPRLAWIASPLRNKKWIYTQHQGRRSVAPCTSFSGITFDPFW